MTASRELALLQPLAESEPFGLPKKALFAEMNTRLTTHRVITHGDFDLLLRESESKKRILSVTAEDDVVVKITPDGKLRLAELNG
jgi:hypothetical protein